MRTYAILILFILLLAGMTKKQTVVAPIPSPIAQAAIRDLDGWNSAWTPTVMAAYPPAGDMTPYCPFWKALGDQNQRNVWLMYWENIIDFESGMDPKDIYVETKMGLDEVTGKQVLSEGLMQLSYQDVIDYPNVTVCKAISYQPNPNAIFDPTANLTCGLAIANWTLKQGDNLGVYWSTARASSDAAKAFRTRVPMCFAGGSS